MALMDFFTNTPKNGGQQPNNNRPVDPANPPVPPPGSNPPAPSPAPNAPAPAPANAMDIYSKLWDNKESTDVAPSFNLDSKVMDEVVSKQDFMRGIDPAVLAKAQSGDAAAMMQLMEHSAKNAYRAAMEHNSTLTDKFVGARESFNEKNVDNRVRKELTAQSLADTPNYKHPVVRQQLLETAERLQRQHPDATPREIGDMAKRYFADLQAAMNPEAANAANPKKKKMESEDTWNSFFDEDPEFT